VTYEYVLLRDVNDRPEHAAELARLLRGRQAHVNLIPFNDVAGLPYRRLTQQALTDFLAVLRSAGLSVKVRKRKGADIQPCRPWLPEDTMVFRGRRAREPPLPQVLK
jgi:23S rRNA (adenine2503-C2)-methyltransferase